MARHRPVQIGDPYVVGGLVIAGGLLSFLAYNVGRSHQGETDRQTLLTLVGAEDQSTEKERRLASSVQ